MGKLFDRQECIDISNERLKNLFAAINIESLEGKTVLETGFGYGYMGSKFEELGATVVSIDAREEHIEVVKERYPLRQSVVFDMDKQDLSDLGPFDIVFSFGLLYHLAKPRFFLEGVAKIAPVLYLESCVCNREEEICYTITESGAFDQSFSGNGSRPSPLWIVNNLKRVGFTKIKDVSGSIVRHDRRIYIAEKD
jgi:cyclopropane fatty-acyl-phospholipid synthase-like methyltransferase